MRLLGVFAIWVASASVAGGSGAAFEYDNEGARVVFVATSFTESFLDATVRTDPTLGIDCVRGNYCGVVPTAPFRGLGFRCEDSAGRGLVAANGDQRGLIATAGSNVAFPTMFRYGLGAVQGVVQGDALTVWVPTLFLTHAGPSVAPGSGTVSCSFSPP